MPLSRAASGDSALSKAKGPSTTAPLTAPLLACLTTSAASTLEGMAGSADSVPDSMATFGSGLPSACAMRTALLMMSILVAVSGCTLTAPSVIIRTRSLSGTVMWKM